MLERFDDGARRVLVLAREEAGELEHAFIGTEHLLLGLLRDDGGMTADVLAAHGASVDAVRDRVRAAVPPTGVPSAGTTPEFTPRAKRVLELSMTEALQLGRNHIAAAHVLLALIREGEGFAAEILRDLGPTDALRRDVLRRYAGDAGVEPPAVAPQAKRTRPPRCQHCLAELQVHARARPLTVPDDDGGAAVPTTVVYCGSCGRDLVAAVDRPGSSAPPG